MSVTNNRTLVEVLKEVENASKKGFKNGKWMPHKSVEGGNDTIAYGHKLDDKEQAGNFVRLPDGTRHFLDQGGLTEEQAMSVLIADIQEHRMIAQMDWNKANKATPFDTLSPRDQDILTELTFNIGTLKNKSGKFGWPNLADAIKDQDIDKIKKEVSRTFNGKKLVGRTNKVRNFIDNYASTTVPLEDGQVLEAPLVDIEGEVRESIQAQLAQENASQRGSESLSEGVTDTVQPIAQTEPAFTPEELEMVEMLKQEREKREADRALQKEYNFSEEEMNMIREIRAGNLQTSIEPDNIDEGKTEQDWIIELYG